MTDRDTSSPRADQPEHLRELVSCRDCKHFKIESDGWEMPHIAWPACSARPQMANLKSFPFMVTACWAFEAKS